MTGAKSKRSKDLAEVAKRESLYSTLAKKESKGTEKRLEKDVAKGHKESAKDDRWELSVDRKFAKTRTKKAESAKRKLLK